MHKRAKLLRLMKYLCTHSTAVMHNKASYYRKASCMSRNSLTIYNYSVTQKNFDILLKRVLTNVYITKKKKKNEFRLRFKRFERFAVGVFSRRRTVKIVVLTVKIANAYSNWLLPISSVSRDRNMPTAVTKKKNFVSKPAAAGHEVRRSRRIYFHAFLPGLAQNREIRTKHSPKFDVAEQPHRYPSDSISGRKRNGVNMRRRKYHQKNRVNTPRRKKKIIFTFSDLLYAWNCRYVSRG